MANFMSFHWAVRSFPVDLDPITLDHRIREQLVGDLGGQRARLLGGRGRELELEVLALADVADARVAQRVQRVGDRLALRIEDRRLQCDEDSGFHRSPCHAPACRPDVYELTDRGTDANTRSKIASTLRS